MYFQMDTVKRNFLKDANKWPKAIVPYKIDKKGIGKIFNIVCFIGKLLTLVLKFIMSYIVLFSTEILLFDLVDPQYNNKVTIFSKKQSISSMLAPV